MKLHYKQIQTKGVHALLGMLIAFALCYVLVLLSLIFAVIERKQNLSLIKEYSSEISSLENDYATYVATMSPSYLKNTSYKKIDTTTFAVRKDEIASYTVLYAR
ncbi:MAG: hypothetical protein RI935_79 [Candidatus Parcubacteria bacterium]|jgi:hypothetical protein